MQEDIIVQFVFFETPLDSDQFISEWDQFNRSVNADTHVTLQQTTTKKGFRYIAQHRCIASEFKFVFTRPKRSSRIPEVEISAKQAGGYGMQQKERGGNTHADESKIFVFVAEPQTDLSVYKKIFPQAKLNIYEAYYENCQFAYILEYFVKSKNAPELKTQLAQFSPVDTGIYTECILQES